MKLITDIENLEAGKIYKVYELYLPKGARSVDVIKKSVFLKKDYKTEADFAKDVKRIVSVSLSGSRMFNFYENPFVVGGVSIAIVSKRDSDGVIEGDVEILEQGELIQIIHRNKPLGEFIKDTFKIIILSKGQIVNRAEFYNGGTVFFELDADALPF